MPISRAKPLDSLYADVAEYDIVVVPDNPLADAIDRRHTEPHFGTFATTPRRLATGRRETAEDRTAFLELVDRLDASWKAIAYAVGNVLQCWEHRGRHDAVLDYDHYVDGTTESVVDAIADLDTTSKRLAEYDIDPNRSVAVVGYDRLTELERSILPETCDRVDPFTDEPFDRPDFHVFDSSSAIVDAVLDTVLGEDADRVAVVVNAASEYASLVEAALEANDVPHYGGPGFADDPYHRAFLGLLRAAYRGSETTVADVRPLCTRVGADVPIDHDAKRIDAVDAPGLDWLAEFHENVDSMTFDGALACFEHRLRTAAGRDRSLDAFREELETLSLADATVTRSRVEDLAFYLQRYEVPVDRDNEGVLLADAKSAAFVDRPVVFHLGMDDGWTHSAPRRPWVDADALFDRHLRQFQSLLQSGTEQYYLVRDTAGGRPVTPCLYLGELLDEEFERFGDLDGTTHLRTTARRSDGQSGFEKERVDVEPTKIATISQSSLNRYANCPRDYLFSRLVDGPDRDYFTEGNLFHDFAEFYVCHPNLVDEDAIAEIVDLIHDEAKAFYHDDETPLRRRKYRIGVEAIVEFLDANRPDVEALDFLTPDTGWGTNTFGEHFGVDVDSPLAERWFENVAVGAKGKIDLVCAPDHLVDYKSGHKGSAYDVVRDAAVDPPADAPNFQAALYLCHFRTQNPGERIDFTLFHFLETLDEAVRGDSSLRELLDDALTTVSYHPESFDDFVANAEAYDILVDFHSDCVAAFEDLGVDTYRHIVEDLAFPETRNKAELYASDFRESIEERVRAAASEECDADLEKACKQAIRALNRKRRRAFFPEDLDAFEEFLADSIAEINRLRTGDGRFPIDGPGGEPNYRRVDHRDCLLEGDRHE